MDRFTAEFDAAPGQATVVRRGKLFETGTFADKSFSLTAEEMDGAIREFQPVLAELEHQPSILDGRLGQLREVWKTESGELGGALEIPQWLHDTIGPDPLKVSLVWDRETKRIRRVGLVRTPRISDAAVFAAFSAATGERVEEGPDEEAYAFFSQLSLAPEGEPRDEEGEAAQFDAAPKATDGGKSSSGEGSVHWVTIDGHPVPITDKGVGPQHISHATSKLGLGYHGHEALHAAHEAGQIETDRHLYDVIRAARGHEAKGESEGDAYRKAIAGHGQQGGPAVRITGQGAIKVRGTAPLSHQSTADLVRLYDAAKSGREAVAGVRDDIGADRVKEAITHAQRLKSAGLLDKAVTAHRAWQEKEERRDQEQVRRQVAREESRTGQGGRGLVQEAASQGYDVHLKDPSTGRTHTYRTLPDNLKPHQYEAIYHELNTSGRQNTRGGKEKLYPVPGGGKLQMFTLHDLVTGEKKLPPGAVRSGGGGSRTAGFSATAAESGKKGQPMNPLTRFLALFATKAGVDPEDADLKALAAEFSADEKTEQQQAPPPTDAPTKEQFAALQAQFAAERRVRLEGEADAFARDIITVQKRALPAEFTALRQQYLQAAEDDAAHGGEVTFGADQKGRRVDALRAAQALRPAHSLTDETMQSGLMALFNRADGDGKQEEPSLDPADIYARRQKAMNGKGA